MDDIMIIALLSGLLALFLILLLISRRRKKNQPAPRTEILSLLNRIDLTFAHVGTAFVREVCFFI